MPILNVDAWPCSWPVGWARTPEPKRRASKYRLQFVESRNSVVRALKLMGATEIVVSTNCPLRRDGLPLKVGYVSDPAVAVYWVVNQTGRVVACDCWRSVRENLRAIAVALDAMRRLERSGATQVIERAYDGFKVLPSYISRDWRVVLGRFAEWAPADLDDVKRAYREMVRKCHPDMGGSPEAMIELDAALRSASEWLLEERK